MKTPKYEWDSFTEEQQDLIADEAYNWDKADRLFWSDNPTCLDDMFPDCWSDWICKEFIEYVENGVFDKEIDELLTTKK